VTRAVALAGLACVLAAAWILYVRLYQHGGGHELAYTDLSGALHEPRFPRPAGKVFRDGEALASFLPGRTRIDLRGREAVLVAAGPRSSTGYSLDVLRVTEERGRIVVSVRERTPRLGDPVRARVTYPYRLIAIPRSRKPVKIDWQGRP
jgi:hypothetical protein